MTATPKTTPSYGKQWAWEHIDRWKRNGYGRDLSEQALKDLEMRAAAAMDSAFNAGVTSVSGMSELPPESAVETQKKAENVRACNHAWKRVSTNDTSWNECIYCSEKDNFFYWSK